jgi:hypothetical protein
LWGKDLGRSILPRGGAFLKIIFKEEAKGMDKLNEAMRLLAEAKQEFLETGWALVVDVRIDRIDKRYSDKLYKLPGKG